MSVYVHPRVREARFSDQTISGLQNIRMPQRVDIEILDAATRLGRFRSQQGSHIGLLRWRLSASGLFLHRHYSRRVTS